MTRRVLTLHLSVAAAIASVGCGSTTTTTGHSGSASSGGTSQGTTSTSSTASGTAATSGSTSGSTSGAGSTSTSGATSGFSGFAVQPPIPVDPAGNALAFQESPDETHLVVVRGYGQAVGARACGTCRPASVDIVTVNGSGPVSTNHLADQWADLAGSGFWSFFTGDGASYFYTVYGTVSGALDLWVANSDGSNPKSVASNVSSVIGAGSTAFFTPYPTGTSAPTLFAAQAGATPVQLGPALVFTPSPAGTEVFANDLGTGLSLYQSNGTLTASFGDSGVGCIAWADGGAFALLGYPSTSTPGSRTLAVVQPDGSGEQALLDFADVNVSVLSVVLSPDNQFVALGGADPDGGDFVWVHPLSNTGDLMFADPPPAPGFGVQNPQCWATPSFSPDSAHVVGFISCNPSGSFTTLQIAATATGSTFAPIEGVSDAMLLSYSPLGNYLAADFTTPNETQVIALANEALSPLTLTSGSADRALYEPVGPTPHLLAVNVMNGGQTYNYNLIVASADGTTLTTLPSLANVTLTNLGTGLEGYYFGWAGRDIVYASAASQTVGGYTQVQLVVASDDGSQTGVLGGPATAVQIANPVTATRLFYLETPTGTNTGGRILMAPLP